MKKIILFILPFYSLFAQNYKVEYENINLLSDKSKKNLSSIIIEDYESPKVNDLLINDDNLCLYKKRELINKGNVEMIGSYITNFVVTNPIEKFIYQDINIENRNYKVKSPLKISDRWKIHRETKNINGIEATKATLETIDRNTEVWFAKSIKSKCGPSNFVGFPGLVLEVIMKPKQDTEATGIIKMKNIEILKDNTVLKLYFAKISENTITLAEFTKAYDEYQKNIQEMYGGNGVDKD